MNSRCENTLTRSLCFGILIGGIFLRFLYLDADPYYYEWIGYITDEGRWVQHGRSLALHGSLLNGNSLHFFLAPLFQLASYVAFELAGVRLLSSRMLTALSGSLVLVLFWGFLRRVVTPQALLMGLILLGFQADLVMLSRVAVPEMSLMCLELAIYFIIVGGGTSSSRLVVAGMLMLVLIAMKLTTLLFLLIFSLIIVFMPRKTARGTDKWRDLGLFWTGFSVPMVIIGSAGYFFLSKELPSFQNHVWDLWIAIHSLLAPANVYSVISFPFEHSLASTFNLWALAMWLAVIGWSAGRQVKIDFQSHRYLGTAAIWFSLYLIVMLSLGYFPSRYKVHILLPMALFIVVGISLLQRLSIRRVIDFLAQVKGPSEVLWLAVFGLPTAALLLPLLGSAVAWIGGDTERVRIKLACFSLSLVATVYILYRLKRNQQAVGFFLVFPLVGAMACAVLSTAVSGFSFWPSASFQFHALWWSLTLLVASAILVICGSIASRWASINSQHLITVYALAYLLILLVRISPEYMNPHYSMRDTSRSLGSLLSGFSTIGIVGADGLFNENSLPYTNFLGANWAVDRPEILVVAFRHEWVKGIVAQEYRPIKTYDLYVSPEYDRSGLNAVSLSSQGVLVTVYEKNGTGEK